MNSALLSISSIRMAGLKLDKVIADLSSKIQSGTLVVHNDINKNSHRVKSIVIEKEFIYLTFNEALYDSFVYVSSGKTSLSYSFDI